MRKYEPIWNQLKATGRCEIVAPAQFHPRIKKLVIKEKYKDCTYKLECEMANVVKELSISSTGNRLCFSLLTSSIGELTVGVDI